MLRANIRAAAATSIKLITVDYNNIDDVNKTWDNTVVALFLPLGQAKPPPPLHCSPLGQLKSLVIKMLSLRCYKLPDNTVKSKVQRVNKRELGGHGSLKPGLTD